MTKVKVLLAAGLFVVPAMALVAGCAREETGAEPVEAAASPGAPDVRSVGVDAVAKDPKAHAGRVGIDGVVAQVFAERGAFTMIDTAEFEECGETGCAEYVLPVEVPTSAFTGELPKSGETVLVIGTVEPNEKGYRFLVEEVRRDGKPLVRKKPAKAP